MLRQDAPLDSLIDLFGGTVQTSFSELGPDRSALALTLPPNLPTLTLQHT